MSDKPYNISVIVGRFQPLHNGHINLIRKAFELGDKVFIFIGYSGFIDMRHFLDPNTISRIITEEFGAESERLYIKAIQDMADDRKWVYKLSNTIDNICIRDDIKKESITFVGAKKDMVWYANLLPSWDIMLLPDNGINATEIRKQYFLGNYNQSKVPETTIKELNIFKEDYKYNYDRLQTNYKDFYSIY